jgi:hypothetical protein
MHFSGSLPLCHIADAAALAIACQSSDVSKIGAARSLD